MPCFSSSLRKGNFGEIAVDLDFFEKGYRNVHVNKVDNIDHPNYQGIDHVFQDEISGQYVIVETKWRSRPISTTLSGRQIAIDNNFSLFTSSATISSSILTAVTNGNLKYIFPTDIKGTILNSSTLIQTNQ